MNNVEGNVQEHEFNKVTADIFPTELLKLDPALSDIHHVISVYLKRLIPEKKLYEDENSKFHIFKREIIWIKNLSFKTEHNNINYELYAKLIGNKIKNKKLVMEYTLPLAIISEVGVENNLNGVLFFELKRITILSVIKLLNREEKILAGSIDSIIRNIRRFASGARVGFAKKISTVDFGLSLFEIKNEFISLWDDNSTSLENRVLNDLILVLEYILDDIKVLNILGGGGHRTVTRIEIEHEYKIAGYKIQELVEIDSTLKSDKNAYSLEEEQRGNSTRSNSYLISPDVRISDLQANIWRASSIALSMSIRTQSLACDLSILSAAQVKKITSYLIDKYLSGGHSAGFAFFMLILGQSEFSLRQINIISNDEKERYIINNKFFIVKKTGKLAVIVRSVKVAHSKIHAKLNKKLNPVDEFIELSLPSVINSIIDDGLCFKISDFQLKETLSEIESHTGVRTTLSQLANYFSNWLQKKGFDQAIIGVLTEKTVKQCAAMAYSQISLMQLNEVWTHYLTDLGLDLSDTELYPSNISDKYIGSRLYPSDFILKKLISTLKEEVLFYKNNKNLKKSDETSNLILFHNMYIRYCLLILNLSTAARPVSNMYGEIDNYCLYSKFIRISDKEARSVPAGRFIPLTDVVVKQLICLEKYLKDIKNKYAIKHKELCSAANSALNSTGPFLFWLREDRTIHNIVSSFKVHIEPVSPKSILEKFDDYLPFPVNWHRHTVRTKLMRCNSISSAIVDQIMGHEKMGHEYAHLFSGASLNDLRPAANILNHWLIDLGVEVLEAKQW